MGMGQTEQTKIRVFARPNRPKNGYWPERTDQNMGIGQNEQTEIRVLARPKYGYWPDQTEQNRGIGQTEQTKVWVLTRPNRPKLPLARRKAPHNFFSDLWDGRTGPPCPRPKSTRPIPVLDRRLHTGYKNRGRL